VAGLDELWINLKAWLVLAIPGGLLAALAWFVLPSQRRRLLPPQRHRAVPWNGAEICAAFLVMLFLPGVVASALGQTEFFQLVYGSEASSEPRRQLWISALSLPMAIGLILLILRYLGHAKWYQLGFHQARLLPDLVGGYLVWLVLTPVVLSLYCLILLFIPPESHTLIKLVQEHPSPIEWGLLVFQAVLAAPILEELIFRGVLQFWLTRKVNGGHAAVVGALAIASLFSEARFTKDASVVQALAPVGFVLLMLPPYVLVSLILGTVRRPRSPLLADWIWEKHPETSCVTTFQAIYGTALLFAAFHSSVWPSPIPLFLLGLGLGWLAYRTQSLIGPIVVHALFNSVACLTLIFTP
jgi:membrane protease YdiL (CAAX protease family)